MSALSTATETYKVSSTSQTLIPPWRTAPSKVWVVLPAYNESGNIAELLRRIDISLAGEAIPYRIVVVDDGSTDGTQSVMREVAPYLPLDVLVHRKNQGLGATVRDGLKEAARLCGPNDVVFVMDADNTHTPALMSQMLRLVREGNDVVIASRFQPGGRVIGVPGVRAVLSVGASFLMRLMFPIPGVRDYTCGYRAYRAETLKAAFHDLGEKFVEHDGFECMVGILLKLRDRKAIMNEVPLILRYDQKRGASKMKVFKTIFRTLRLVFASRFRPTALKHSLETTP